MYQLLVIVTLFTFATSSVILTDKEWTLFKETHGKTYLNSEEETYRKNIFNENLKKIKLHNEKAIRGEHSYQLGITKFADLTINETKMPEIEVEPQPLDVKFHHKSYFKAPESVDWRTKGILTRIKDQGACPSCWAFTGAAVIEAAYAQATGKLVNLSAQDILDCAPKSKGCTIGFVSTGYQYAMSKGLRLENCYPYESHDDLFGQKACKVNSECDRIKIKDFVYVPRYNENALRDAVAEHVVARYIYADLQDFVFYKEGIYNSPNCPKDKITHLVPIVGYGTENGTPYWIFKNSWGEHWGENGYGRILRGNNTCGIAIYNSSYPRI
ncbi:cathepsin L1-like [Tetranychus urticae]|nr:cathepsin L1-like [Tetranychus urticae]